MSCAGPFAGGPSREGERAWAARGERAVLEEALQADRGSVEGV